MLSGLQEQYADETFVHVLPAGQIPHTRHVRGSNFVYISVFPDRLPGRAIIISGTAPSNKVMPGSTHCNCFCHCSFSHCKAALNVVKAEKTGPCTAAVG